MLTQVGDLHEEHGIQKNTQPQSLQPQRAFIKESTEGPAKSSQKQKGLLLCSVVNNPAINTPLFWEASFINDESPSILALEETSQAPARSCALIDVSPDSWHRLQS